MAIIGPFKSLLELYKPKNNFILPCHSEIDVLDAINVHIKWKILLRDYVNGKVEEQLDPLSIEGDKTCILGSWLYTSGVLSLSGYYDFQKLQEVHAHFHRCAGKVVRLHHDGNREGAELILNEEYDLHANNIFVLLTSLHESMNKNIL